MIMTSIFLVTVLWSFAAPAVAATAKAPEPTACGLVNGADAQKFIGGPLDVKESARVPTADGPDTYNSICSYIGRGESLDNMLTASRVLDITLHFLSSVEDTSLLYDSSIEQYRQMSKSADSPFANATITPIGGFGDKAFVIEAVTDRKTGYKSALIVFYKGKVAGSVAAWKRPDSSVDTTKAVMKHLLGKLP